LQAARQMGRSWIAASATTPVSFKAFPDVRHEEYRLYHDVTA